MSSPEKIKEEDDGDSKDKYSLEFRVKLEDQVHRIFCRKPCTVLEAIKSNSLCDKEMKKKKWKDANIVIQLGEADMELSIPTHFPCSLLKHKDLLIMSHVSSEVEKVHIKNSGPNDNYALFKIDTIGGKNSTSKKLFKNTFLKRFKYLYVYGVHGMSVEEALKNDGRFRDDLGDFDFELSDNENKDAISRAEKVEDIKKKELKIVLNSKKFENKTQCESDTKGTLDVVKQKGVSVKTAAGKRGSDNTAEIYKLQQKQRQWMESRFQADSFQEELRLSKEKFGKIQASFSEVHRVRKLLKLGESVCKVIGTDICQGTGFVLFDNYIMTNAHMLKPFVTVKGNEKMLDREVYALFDYEETAKSKVFTVHDIVDIDFDELDYAVLSLEDDAVNTVPLGLLGNFGPMPQNGEACIIGHPKGEVKKMDPTCIIGKTDTDQKIFITHKINEEIKNQGTENMIDGKKADEVVTYHTSMYYGSSGSPVFDADCRVFGLHTAGFVYEEFGQIQSVIEFAHPLLYIFEKFVSKLKETGNEEILDKVQENMQENPHLEEVLGQQNPMSQ